MTFRTPNGLASLIEAAVNKRSAAAGRAAHGQILKTLENPLPAFISNHLINMYSKLDLPNSAFLVLSLAPSRSVVSWTALIAGSVQNGLFSTALLRFVDMLREGITPNDFTFPCAFKASGSLRAPKSGKQVHGLAIKTGLLHDVFVGCSAFDMYSKTGFIDDAIKMFDEMPERNLATWNSYISNSVLSGHPRKAVSGFMELRRIGGEPNSITFCAFLNACSDALYLQLGQQLHGFVIRYGYESDVSVSNGMIDFYGKCSQVTSSESIFARISDPNDVSWCSMLVVYEQNDEGVKACSIFTKARKEGIKPTDFMVSSILSACAALACLELGRSIHAIATKACIDENIFVGSALVDMYGKCGIIEDCEASFHELPQRNLVTYNSLLSGYAHQGHADMALSLFRELTFDFSPNYVTLVCILSACSRGGEIETGMEIFESMTTKYGIRPGVEHYACVADMLGRSGKVEQALDFIKKMPIRPSVAVWGSVLGACRVHGKPELGKIAAEKLFELDPHDSGNHVVLSNTFAAAGRWEEADLVRRKMKEVGIKKGVGRSWIYVNNTIHVFQAKDTSHDRNMEIQAMLREFRGAMKSTGYTSDTKVSLYDLEEEEKEIEVWHHSEKLALAFGLVALQPGVPVRITKNLRICVDCHSTFKFISGIYRREIVVRDSHRFHRFENHQCSCKDYW